MNSITHYGHACVLIEFEGVRILVDPGTYASGFEGLTGLDIILITHAHPDHLDEARLAALRLANPGAVLISNPAGAEAAGAQARDIVVRNQALLEVASIQIRPTGESHAPMYPELPIMSNTGFLIGDYVWHPGDAFDAEPQRVDVLLLPVGGPWMKVADAIDFARAVAPRIIIPIHQAGLASVHQQLHYGLLRNFVPGSELRVLVEGETSTI